MSPDHSVPHPEPNTMRHALLIAMFIASLVVPLQALAQGPQPYCPAECVPVPDELESGNLPSILEVYFVLEVTSSTPGSATPYCLTTCEPCRLFYTFAFHRYSGSYCWQLENNAGSTEIYTTNYSRPGILTAICDDPVPPFITAKLLNCGSTPPAAVYTKKFTLACPCSYTPPPGGGGGGG